MTGYREVLDLCIYNDSPRSRTFLQSLCFYLIKTRPPLFNCAIKQTVRNRWGETTSWSATIWGATFPDLLPFGASFFPPKALHRYNFAMISTTFMQILILPKFFGFQNNWKSMVKNSNFELLKINLFSIDQKVFNEILLQTLFAYISKQFWEIFR